MKPVSYQSMPSSVNGGHSNLALDHLLSTTNVLSCEKCGFTSADAVGFKKHMIEHMGTRFYCFYCNSVSFSEAELNEHLKLHTSKYPFKCPHCGQGYMRRRCLMKHIDRLHSKNISQGPAKPGMAKSLHVPVSSALTSAPTSDLSPLRPLVRVTVPTPAAVPTPAVLLRKDDQRGKTLDTNLSNSISGNTERAPSLNGLIQHNRALTVSLPEEVTIPAGCLVELVEVKTVNGTKELKLRLVSQQENESVIKDTKTAVCPNTTGGKSLLLSTPHSPNTVRSMSMGMCTVNRKQFEAKAVNVERPAVVPANISCNPPSLASKEKNGLKRASSEIINLECNTVIPNKVSKSNLSPMREGNNGIRVTQTAAGNHGAASPAAIAGRVANRLSTSLHPGMGASVPQRVMDDRKNATLQHSKSVPPRRASDTNSVQDVSAAVKLEPRENCIRSNSSSKAVKEVVCLNQQSTPASKSLSVPVAAVTQVRPSPILVSKDNVVNQPFPILRTLRKPSPIKISIKSSHTNPETSPWTQEVRCNDTAKGSNMSKPESFPVISSVFSLSEQQEGGQGPIQPLVMALRGIVMDKKHSSNSKTQDHIKITNGTDQMCKALTSEQCARADTANGFFTHDVLLTEQASQSLKAEDEDKGVLHPLALTQNSSLVKEENNDSKISGGNKPSPTPASESSACEESKIALHVDKTSSHVQVSTTTDPLQETDKTEHDVSKFLTISLKRVQVGVWRKRKKGLKLRISRYKPQTSVSTITDCTFISLMPLKEDQLVQQPGPNQPVVVLNHPKPRISVHGTRTDTFADMKKSEAVPKCQILKMRLSKVMGQKYEVMGCTVGVFP